MAVSLPFPNESHFRVFLRHCQKSLPGDLLFKDPSCGIEADHRQFLQDVYTTRQTLLNGLPGTFDHRNLIHEEHPFICVLNQGNYSFIVASFAVLILGGAVAPLSPSILPEEASHLMRKCQSTALMAGPTVWDRASTLKDYAASQQQDIHLLPIAIHSSPGDIAPSIDETMTIAPERPSMLVFTSGTVGPPKGVVHARRLLALPDTPPWPGTYLNCVSLWTVGAVRLIKHTLRARRIEIITTDPAVLWARLRQGDIAFLAAVPPVWQGMMEYFKKEVDPLPTAQRDKYLCGLRRVRTAMVTGGTLIPSRLRFWRDLGKALKLCYGATELGKVCLITGDDSDPDRNNCLGRAAVGTSIKLSEGDHGELLIKSPAVFSHYLNDVASTKAAFTDDGYYRTGDLVSREGSNYFFHGRASTDFIKYHGYQIPILSLEQQLGEVAGVDEGYILAMPDEGCGYRAAALIRLSKEAQAATARLDLPSLRAQLADKVAAFMLPTALRFLEPGETIPRTISGKIIRRDAAKWFFPLDDDGVCTARDVQVWRARPTVYHDGSARAWDWAAVPMG